MDAKLVVVGGEARVTEVQLKLPTNIGRGRSAGLTLPHPLVSRQHCEIYEEDGKLVVNDLGSLNGTFVGDQRIGEPTFLMPGELLTVGTVTFRAVYELSGEDVDFVDEESTGAEVASGDQTVRAGGQTVADAADDEVEVEEVDIVDVDEVEFAEAEQPDSADAEVELVAELEEVEVAAEEVELQQKVGGDTTKGVDEIVAAEIEDVDVEDVEVAEVEDVELVEEVEPQPRSQPKPKSSAGSDTEADHDTKEVASADEDEAEQKDDDLQAFLRGLG